LTPSHADNKRPTSRFGFEMPKVSQLHRDSRRRQILDAALACFSDDGFHQTGMAEIVRRSGLSRGAVYGYFASKDDIIEAIADDRHQHEAALNEVAQQTSDPVEGLHRLVRSYAEWLKDPAGVPARRVGVHGWAEALRSDRIKALIVAGVDSPRTTITLLVERAQRSGQISNELSADAIARSFIALFQGFVLQATWGSNIDIEACVAVVDHMLLGLRPSDGCTGGHIDAVS
jgi:AcrR family transcriptional regulator